MTHAGEHEIIDFPRRDDDDDDEAMKQYTAPSYLASHNIVPSALMDAFNVRLSETAFVVTDVASGKTAEALDSFPEEMWDDGGPAGYVVAIRFPGQWVAGVCIGRDVQPIDRGVAFNDSTYPFTSVLHYGATKESSRVKYVTRVRLLKEQYLSETLRDGDADDGSWVAFEDIDLPRYVKFQIMTYRC